MHKEASGHRLKLLTALETALDYKFQDMALLERALTHASVGDGLKASNPRQNNERLEFLGDRVLGLMIAEALIETFPEASEGELSQRLHGLVSRETCADIASELKLGQALRLAAGETKSGGRNNLTILGDACEALIAAIYLDGGLETTKRIFLPLWAKRLNVGMQRAILNPKSYLQEWAAQKGLPSPRYETLNRSGPDHAPIFTVSVTIEGYPPNVASARSRQDAEKASALAFIDRVITENTDIETPI
jgi:ribonuclease III